jgi:hypothetical protein
MLSGDDTVTAGWRLVTGPPDHEPVNRGGRGAATGGKSHA